MSQDQHKRRKKLEVEPFNSPEFKKLQSQWYSKLQKEGFKDIELMVDRNGFKRTRPAGTKYVNSDRDTRNEQLMVYNNYKTIDKAPGTEIIFSYYRLCRIFLTHGIFASKIHKTIFEKYSEGKSYREIAIEHNQALGNPPTKKQKTHGNSATALEHKLITKWNVSKIMEQNKKDLLNFHLTHPEGEYNYLSDLSSEHIPAILNPKWSPYLNTRRGKSKYGVSD